MNTTKTEGSERFEPDENMIRQLQHKVRKSRSYTEFEAQYGINIQQRSLINATRVIAQLSDGEDFIEKHRQNHNPDKAPSSSPKQQDQPVKTMEILSDEEQLLENFIVDNLSLKHASNAADEILRSSSIIAVKQLSLSNNDIFRNTSTHSAVDNNVFFTLGIGDHPITPFLDKAKIVIIIDIPQMRQTNPLALSGLWVSPHLSEYQLSRQSPTMTLGDTTYYYTHSWKSLCKTYFYQRSNGDVYKRTVKFADEIYASRELDKAIAHELVLHLRFIGGSYRQHILGTVSDRTLSLDQKLNIISTAMTAIMPGWVFPEAKIPVKFSIKDTAVRVKHLRQTDAHFIDSKLRSKHTKSLVDDCAVASFLREFELDKPDYAPSPIVQALGINANCHKSVSTLLDAGFNINGHGEVRCASYMPENLSALQLAFKKQDYALCQFLFSAQSTHLLDKCVKFGLLPPDSNDLILLLTDENKPQTNTLEQFFSGPQQTPIDDRHLLKIYIELRRKFPVVDNFGVLTLLLAIASGYQNLANYLLDNVSTEHLIRPHFKCNFQSDTLFVTALHAAASRGMIDVIQKIVAKKLTRIDILTPSGHSTVSREVDSISGESESHTFYRSGGGTCLHTYIEANEDLTQIPTFIKMGIDPAAKDGNGETAYSLISGKIEALRSDRDYRECRESLEHFDDTAKKYCSEQRITLAQFKKSGDYDNVKEALMRAMKTFEARIAQLTTHLEYLSQLGVNTTTEKTPAELCVHRHSTVAAIIVGRTPRGETIVVLGEKKQLKDCYADQSLESTALTQLMFPGGLKDAMDADHYAAMIREVQEETGLDLNAPTLKPKITTHYRYHKLGAGNHAHYQHVVYLVDLGEALYHSRLYAREDLCKLYKVPVSLLRYHSEADPQQQFQLTLRGQSFFVRHSNAVSIQALFADNLPKALSLEPVFDFEFDSYYMACDAAARGDIALLETLKAYGTSFEPTYKQSSLVKTTPVREAVAHGQIISIQWFVANKIKMDDIGKLNIYSAAVKHVQLKTLAFLCEQQISYNVMWYAICDAEKENKLECLKLMLNYLVLFLDTKKPLGDGGPLESLANSYQFGLKAAIKQGWKDIAGQLILDGRIDANEIVSYGDESAYNHCLKQGWFDLLFQFAMNELQYYINKQNRQLEITFRKTDAGYEISTSTNGFFVPILRFAKEIGMYDFQSHERLFNLLVLAHLSGYGSQKQSQTSALTHFKPSYADLADFAYQCCSSQSPGHEIAQALLEKIALEKKDAACQTALAKLQSTNSDDSLVYTAERKSN